MLRKLLCLLLHGLILLLPVEYSSAQYKGYEIKIAHSCRLRTEFRCEASEGPISIQYGFQGYDYCHHSQCCPRSWDCKTLLDAEDIAVAKKRCDGLYFCRLQVSRGGPACHKGFGDYTNITYACGGDPKLGLKGSYVYGGGSAAMTGEDHIEGASQLVGTLHADPVYNDTGGHSMAVGKSAAELQADDNIAFLGDLFDDDLEEEVIAAIVIGCVVFVGLIVGIILCVYCRKKKKKKKQQQARVTSLSTGAVQINQALGTVPGGTAPGGTARPQSRLSYTSSSGTPVPGGPVLFETSLGGDTSPTRKDAVAVHTQSGMLAANGFQPPQQVNPGQRQPGQGGQGVQPPSQGRNTQHGYTGQQTPRQNQANRAQSMVPGHTPGQGQVQGYPAQQGQAVFYPPQVSQYPPQGMQYPAQYPAQGTQFPMQGAQYPQQVVYVHGNPSQQASVMQPIYISSQSSQTSGYSSSNGYHGNNQPAVLQLQQPPQGQQAPARAPDSRPPMPLPRDQAPPHQSRGGSRGGSRDGRSGTKLYDTPLSVRMSSAPSSPDPEVYEQLMNTSGTYDELNERTINYNQRHTMAPQSPDPQSPTTGSEVRRNTVRFSENSGSRSSSKKRRSRRKSKSTTSSTVKRDTTYTNDPEPVSPVTSVMTSAVPAGKAPHEMLIEDSDTESAGRIREVVAEVYVEENPAGEEYLAPYMSMNKVTTHTAV